MKAAAALHTLYYHMHLDLVYCNRIFHLIPMGGVHDGRFVSVLMDLNVEGHSSIFHIVVALYQLAEETGVSTYLSKNNYKHMHNMIQTHMNFVHSY